MSVEMKFDEHSQIGKIKLKNTLSSFVVPCYNEEEVLPIFIDALSCQLYQMGIQNYEIIFVEDGSCDKTLDVIKDYAAKDSHIKYLSFSRNFGKEGAILAGLKASKGDYITIMDADMQDPPALLPEMYDAILNKGFDCVATRRKDRIGEAFIKSVFSNLFYYVMNKLSQVKLIAGARDYRLMTRQVADAILSLPENTRFSKGIYEWVGFKTKRISFANVKRAAGDTKWSITRLFFYALDGITAFSTIPLALASIMGISFCLLSSLAIIFIIVRQLMYHNSAFGWSYMMCVIIFLSGLQLMCLGVIGQYLAKAYLETKKRPSYIVRESNIKSKNLE